MTELSFAIGMAALVAAGVYLALRPRVFPVLVGLTLLSYAVNLFIFASGRLMSGAAPLVVAGRDTMTDPLPQALVLTAIVISFGMTAYVVALALKAKGETGTDQVDGREDRL